jgi:hypothetical protein
LFLVVVVVVVVVLLHCQQFWDTEDFGKRIASKLI